MYILDTIIACNSDQPGSWGRFEITWNGSVEGILEATPGSVGAELSVHNIDPV